MISWLTSTIKWFGLQWISKLHPTSQVVVANRNTASLQRQSQLQQKTVLFIFIFFLFEKNEAWHFMQIVFLDFASAQADLILFRYRTCPKSVLSWSDPLHSLPVWVLIMVKILSNFHENFFLRHVTVSVLVSKCSKSQIG